MEKQTLLGSKYVAPVAIIAMLAISYGVVTYARAYANYNQYPSRSFSVTGEGKAVVVPDIGEFRFSVLTEGGNDLGKLQKDNTDKVNKAIAYVKSQGVEAKDIKTAGYNVNPRYEYASCDKGICPPPKIVGYTVSQDVTVKIRKFDAVGEVLAGVVQNGANSVSELTFTVDDKTKIQNEARAEAIKMAQEKARSVAEAGNFRLGKMVSLYEDMNPAPMYAYGMGAGGSERSQSGGGSDMAAPQAVPTPTIEPGTTEITVNVNVTYEIK